jgi:hypothetical protein
MLSFFPPSFNNKLKDISLEGKKTKPKRRRRKRKESQKE